MLLKLNNEWIIVKRNIAKYWNYIKMDLERSQQYCEEETERQRQGAAVAEDSDVCSTSKYVQVSVRISHLYTIYLYLLVLCV